MTDTANRHRQIVVRDSAVATRRAAQEIEALVGLQVSGVSARVRIRAIQDAKRHAREMAELMDIAAALIETVRRAQDLAREQTVRQELSADLHQNETDRQRDMIAEDKHQRTLADKRRALEVVKADTEGLLAKQTLRAKEKFEPLKHAIGEERFKTEAARRKVGAAEAYAAIAEAELPEAPPAPEIKPTSEEKVDSRASVVSGLLENVRTQLRESRADDADNERRTELIADEAALERMLAELLKVK